MADVELEIKRLSQAEYQALSKKERKKHHELNQQQFKKTVDALHTEAQALVNNVLPQKITDLDSLYKKFGVIDTALVDVVANITLPGGMPANSEDSKIDDEPTVGKKRKITSQASQSMNGKQQKTMAATQKMWSKKELSSEEFQRVTSHVPTNPAISRVLIPLKKEALQLVEVIGLLKIWIQLNIPRIEDGNNFGVGVQEEILGEVSRVEDAAFSVIDQITKYYVTRGKLVSKVLKWSGIGDYREGVKELDEKQYIQLRLNCLDMRNHYYLLYDMITKNMEKLKKPRSSHTAHMF